MIIYTKHDPRFHDKRLYKGGGGGTSTTVQSIPDELKPLAAAYADKAIGLAEQGFTPYEGQRNAGLNTAQNLGYGMTMDRALNGDPTINAGSNFLQNQLNGTSRGATQNYAGGVNAQRNPYLGQNPYLDSMVKKSQDSVADQFNTMVKPQTETAMSNSGSFGNAGLNEVMQGQQKAAASQMADISNSMYGQAYNTDQQLGESAVNRDLQAQQFNSNLGESFASRNDQAMQNFAQNGMNAANLGLQYGNQAYTDANQLGKVGQSLQNQEQNDLDFNYQQFQDAVNLPYKQLGAMSGVFGSNLGGSSTTTQQGGGK